MRKTTFFTGVIMRSDISHRNKESNTWSSLICGCCFFAMFTLVGTGLSYAQKADSKATNKENTQARVTGIRYICVHVLELEKTLKLYREILGFKMHAAEVFHGPGLEGMLVMKLKANDLMLTLSLTAPENWDQVGPIGNTNHNHFMLRVNDITTIGDKLKEEGYELENNNYARDKYTFFTGPNGEIVGLSEYD